MQNYGDIDHNKNWLVGQIEKERKSTEEDDTYKPFTMNVNGEEVVMRMSHAKDDQLTILVTVMLKLREWIECATSNDPAKAATFKPLRMTIRGSAGAGKSFFIKCLANSIRKVFNRQDVVHVAAPTGAAAFNVGGETLHRKWSINPHKPSQEIGEETKSRLKNAHRRVLAFIIEERSMLTADVLGAAERNSSSATHGGNHDDEEWGGVPIVIKVGDDYQLPPPTNREKGAFDTMDSKSSWSQQNLSGTASFGSELFTTMSEHCMELTSIKRQNSSQSQFKDLLGRVRLGDANYHDANTLLDLHLSNYSSQQRKQILNEGVVMHLFATKAPRNEHNYQRLSETSDENNPVALVKAQWSSTRGLSSSTIAQHYNSPPESATLLCRRAMVRIVDRNFEPGWGLYNNSIGTVRDIVFAPGDDPNSGDLPQYVAVEFSHYTGPAWDPGNPKVRKNTKNKNTIVG